MTAPTTRRGRETTPLRRQHTDEQRQPDPETPGATVWFSTDYDGNPEIALVADELDGKPCVSVLAPVIITPAEVDGCNLGSYPDWDSALEFALVLLEDEPQP